MADFLMRQVGETVVWGHYLQQGLDLAQMRPDARVLRLVQVPPQPRNHRVTTA